MPVGPGRPETAEDAECPVGPEGTGGKLSPGGPGGMGGRVDPGRPDGTDGPGGPMPGGTEGALIPERPVVETECPWEAEGSPGGKEGTENPGVPEGLASPEDPPGTEEPDGPVCVTLTEGGCHLGPG